MMNFLKKTYFWCTAGAVLGVSSPRPLENDVTCGERVGCHRLTSPQNEYRVLFGRYGAKWVEEATEVRVEIKLLRTTQGKSEDVFDSSRRMAFMNVGF